ncbi:hypothetical protein [Geitlerinema sp. P-1104]|nr:hypothetical protein [Geitlerinema sp. P-1104]
MPNCCPDSAAKGLARPRLQNAIARDGDRAHFPSEPLFLSGAIGV